MMQRMSHLNKRESKVQIKTLLLAVATGKTAKVCCMINKSHDMDTVIGSSHLYDGILFCMMWTMHVLLSMDAAITAAGASNSRCINS